MKNWRRRCEIVVQTNVPETMKKNIDQIMNLALVGGLLAFFIENGNPAAVLSPTNR